MGAGDLGLGAVAQGLLVAAEGDLGCVERFDTGGVHAGGVDVLEPGWLLGGLEVEGAGEGSVGEHGAGRTGDQQSSRVSCR